jgi:hypothetical protein
VISDKIAKTINKIKNKFIKITIIYIIEVVIQHILGNFFDFFLQSYYGVILMERGGMLLILIFVSF